MLSWWYSDTNASSGCRAVTMYVTRGSDGISFSGVCVLMNRRCRCPARWAYTLSRGKVGLSSQGERLHSGSGRSGVWKMSKAQIICIQVVPDFGKVLMTMSPGRKRKPDHLPPSSPRDWPRIGAEDTR
jgi:hypothetical protein